MHALPYMFHLPGSELSSVTFCIVEWSYEKEISWGGDWRERLFGEILKPALIIIQVCCDWKSF